jgi:flagellar motor switch protein FliN/FliY
MEEIAAIRDVPLEIGVELNRHMLTLRQILELDAGSIVQMNQSAGENIDLYVGRKLIAFGEIVIIENTMGVRITNFRVDA